MIIENINSQTWPQTKFVIIISIFQVLVAILFCIFVRYDASIDPKFAESHSSTEYDPYPCKLDIWIIKNEYIYRVISYYFDFHVLIAHFLFKFRDHGYTSNAFRWFWFSYDISSPIRVFCCLSYDDNYRCLCRMVYIGYWIHQHGF